MVIVIGLSYLVLSKTCFGRYIYAVGSNKEVAKLTGITIRTLHYYDEIGLLEPTKADKTKYRLYSENDLEKLQQILFYREVGFSLKEIKALLC